uniref:Uncharacterized protein n=1 Tax=Graphocephala atropunctata TaxID=36148 RepID=A0A1B6LRR5_9HEMI
MSLTTLDCGVCPSQRVKTFKFIQSRSAARLVGKHRNSLPGLRLRSDKSETPGRGGKITGAKTDPCGTPDYHYTALHCHCATPLHTRARTLHALRIPMTHW